MRIEVRGVGGEKSTVPNHDDEALVVEVPNDEKPVLLGLNGPEVVQDEKRGAPTTKPEKDNRDDLDEI